MRHHDLPPLGLRGMFLSPAHPPWRHSDRTVYLDLTTISGQFKS